MKHKPAFTLYPTKFHQVVDHGTSVCLQFNDITVRNSKVEGKQFLSQNDMSFTVHVGGTNIARMAIRIPKELLEQVREALNGI